VTGSAAVAPFAGDTSVGALGAAGFTVNVAVLVAPLNAAEIVAVVEAVTEVVVIVKFALVEPAGTVTLAGTLVALELSDRATTVPPLGAAALRVTVPREEAPPDTLPGLTETVDRDPACAAGVTFTAANWNTLSIAAES
jgi:hypothetical protein